MKTMMYLLTTVALMLAFAPAATFGYDMSVPLIADGGSGGGTQVGTVEITLIDASTLEVVYVIDAGSYLVETHLHVADDPSKIPQTGNGNPKIGKFDFSDPVTDPSGQTYSVDLDALGLVGDDPLYVAAHAVVITCAGACDICDFADVLPETVSVDVTHPGGPSYFDLIISDGGILDGPHEGWCADSDSPIENDEFEGSLVLTGCDDLSDLLEHPENLNAVNWVLNNAAGLGYTVPEIQWAIWLLLDDSTPDPAAAAFCSWHAGPSPCWTATNATNAADLRDLALAAQNDDDYEPGCGELVAVFILPPAYGVDEPRQLLLIGVPPLCEETAWGDGTDFTPPDDGKKNRSWAEYITFDLPE